MSEYLRKAADLLDKVSESNEKASYMFENVRDIKRQELVVQYAMLAAIDKGLLPEPVAEQVYDQFKTLTSR